MWDYGAVLAAISFVACVTGQLSINWLVRKTGRASILVLVLAGMIMAAAGLTFYVTIAAFVAAARDPGAAFALHALCAAAGH
jgi:hypothetical protein